MKDLNLHDALKQQLMEDEFKNEETDLELADSEQLVNERRLLKKKIKSIDFQANGLIERLYMLQKRDYDDMVIIDSDHQDVSRPWKSSNEYTSNQYAWWELNQMHLAVKRHISEVAIRKNGNDKNIQVLKNICTRLNFLNDLSYKLDQQVKDIKKWLNTDYGSFSDD